MGKIEEIEEEVKKLFGNNDITMPILLIPPSNTIKTKISMYDFLQAIDNIDNKRKCSIKRKN